MVSNAPIAALSTHREPVAAVSPRMEKAASELMLFSTKTEGTPAVEELHSETSKPAEVMLFAKRAEYSTQAPTLTATSKPAYEHASAAVASTNTTPSLFTQNGEGRTAAVTGFVHHTGAPTELASALSSPESNHRGSDKHDDERNAFLSAHKSLADVRMEALDDDILSIMALC